MSKYSGEYQQFFESPAGRQCLTTIAGLIDSNHQHAEDVPDSARDYMQRAKGNREVLAAINSIMNMTKVNPYSKSADTHPSADLG